MFLEGEGDLSPAAAAAAPPSFLSGLRPEEWPELNLLRDDLGLTGLSGAEADAALRGEGGVDPPLRLRFILDKAPQSPSFFQVSFL